MIKGRKNIVSFKWQLEKNGEIKIRLGGKLTKEQFQMIIGRKNEKHMIAITTKEFIWSQELKEMMNKSIRRSLRLRLKCWAREEGWNQEKLKWQTFVTFWIIRSGEAINFAW